MTECACSFTLSVLCNFLLLHANFVYFQRFCFSMAETKCTTANHFQPMSLALRWIIFRFATAVQLQTRICEPNLVRCQQAGLLQPRKVLSFINLKFRGLESLEMDQSPRKVLKLKTYQSDSDASATHAGCDSYFGQ